MVRYGPPLMTFNGNIVVRQVQFLYLSPKTQYYDRRRQTMIGEDFVIREDLVDFSEKSLGSSQQHSQRIAGGLLRDEWWSSQRKTGSNLSEELVAFSKKVQWYFREEIMGYSILKNRRPNGHISVSQVAPYKRPCDLIMKARDIY